uniref:Uncharacterized protein n=1 Tax=Meloidogyne enterolobii TaxID=390850 RepID=A0A6V7VFQ1_MELEN|nr:unnamed protein product [Meloidogyne enterolobii]
MSTENRDFSALLNTKCERKMKRKAAKQLKSTCKKAQSQQQINVESIVAKQLEETKRKKKLEKRRRLRNKKIKEKLNWKGKRGLKGEMKKILMKRMRKGKMKIVLLNSSEKRQKKFVQKG